MANNNNQFQFVHYKLDAYRVSSELADLVMVVARQVPRDKGTKGWWTKSSGRLRALRH